ncbi:MAG: gamma-glutamyltransferase [Myxococcota bacterium]
MAGVVAAGDPQTADAGATLLRAGGNAVDAAVGMALAACVAEPLLCSVGGGGMMTVFLTEADPLVFDFFPAAPELRREDLTTELAFHGTELDFGSAVQTFHIGRGSVAAPLVLDGLAEAQGRYGRLGLATVTAPAIALCRDGVIVTPATASVFELLWGIVASDPKTAALYSGDGQPPTEGTRLKNPALAQTLEDFAHHHAAPPAFRRALRSEFGPEAGGLLDDRALAVAPRIVAPALVELQDSAVFTAPRAGGAALREILHRLDGETTEGEVAAALAHATVLRDLRPVAARSQTTHASVVDGSGQAASVTLSNGEGSGLLIGDTGVQANNFLGEEDINPRGFHRYEPGAPLPSMIAPTVALRHRSDGPTVFALGSGGANRIRSAMGRVTHACLSKDAWQSRDTSLAKKDASDLTALLEAAVHAPRVHAEGDAAWVELEGWEAPEAVQAALRREFDEVREFPRQAFFFGGVHAVARRADGAVGGVGDRRRGGATRTE